MIIPNSLAISSDSWAYGTVLSLVICDRGGCQHVLKGSSSTFQQPPLSAAPAAVAVVVRPSCRRVLKALQALPLEALHLAHTKPVYHCDVWRACLGQQTPTSRVVVSLISSRSEL